MSVLIEVKESLDPSFLSWILSLGMLPLIASFSLAWWIRSASLDKGATVGWSGDRGIFSSSSISSPLFSFSSEKSSKSLEYLSSSYRTLNRNAYMKSEQKLSWDLHFGRQRDQILKRSALWDPWGISEIVWVPSSLSSLFLLVYFLVFFVLFLTPSLEQSQICKSNFFK